MIEEDFFLWIQVGYSHVIVVYFNSTELFSTLLYLYVDLKVNGYNFKMWQYCEWKTEFSRDWVK